MEERDKYRCIYSSAQVALVIGDQYSPRVLKPTDGCLPSNGDDCRDNRPLLLSSSWNHPLLAGSSANEQSLLTNWPPGPKVELAARNSATE